jgi:hypothetical protein
MHTITIQVNDRRALKILKQLENAHSISVLEDWKTETPALPGGPLSIGAFKKWIKDAEIAPTISLDEANERWANKRRQLEHLTD